MSQANRGPPVLDRRLKHLIRVQILSPLSILLSLGALAVGTFITRPTLSEVSEKHWTYLSPREGLLLIYWAVLYLSQICFALFITLGSGSEHAQSLISSGIGLRLAFANLMLTAWVPLWLVNTYATAIANMVLLSLAALGLFLTVVWIQFKSDLRPHFTHRPFEWICVHMPVRLFLAVLLHVDIWQSLFMVLDLDLAGGKKALAHSTWPAFAAITGVSIVSSLWIFATTDFVWFCSAVFLYVSILLHPGPSSNPIPFPLPGNDGDKKQPKDPKDVLKELGDRPTEILAALLLAIALHTTSFIASIAWSRLMKRREGRIALPLTDEEEAAAADARRGRLAHAGSHGGASARASRHSMHTTHEDEEPSQGNDTLIDTDGNQVTPSQLEQGDRDNKVHVTRKLGSSQS